MHLVTLVAEAPISMRANFPDMINSINITPLKLTLGVCSLQYALQQVVVLMHFSHCGLVRFMLVLQQLMIEDGGLGKHQESRMQVQKSEGFYVCVTQTLLLSHSSLLLYTELASMCCLDLDQRKASLEPACSLLACFLNLACWMLQGTVTRCLFASNEALEFS